MLKAVTLNGFTLLHSHTFQTMDEQKTTPEKAQPPPTEKEVHPKKVGGGKNAPAAHKSNGSEQLLLMFSSSDPDKEAPPQAPPPKGTGAPVAEKAKAGDPKGEAAGKGIKAAGIGEEGGKATTTTTTMITAAATTPAMLTAPQVDCTVPLPSDYVQFFVNPKEQVAVKSAAEPVKQATEPPHTTKKTEKSKQGAKQVKEQQQQQGKEPLQVTKPDEVQTIHSSDGVKPRIIKCRNGVPESLIKAIREYMDKQK